MITVTAVEWNRQDQCFTKIRLNPNDISQYQLTDEFSANRVCEALKENNISVDVNALIGGTSICKTGATRAWLYIKETPEQLDNLIEEHEGKRKNAYN